MTTRCMRLLVAALCAGIAGVAVARDMGLRFSSNGVLDLASWNLALPHGQPVPERQLDAADSEQVFAAAAITEENPAIAFSDDVFGCKPPSHACSVAREKALIAAARGVARRDGKRLFVTPEHGEPAVYNDFVKPETKTAEGDLERHWYLGRMAGSGYDRVEVEFGHDSPGSFLMNPRNGEVMFVHNIGDIAAPSPDGRLLIEFNTLNAPLSLRVAALDEAGPRLALLCAAPDRNQRLTPVFKGWHDASAFDVVVEIGEQSKSMARLALRIGRDAQSWQLGASDPARLADLGLACKEPTAP